MKSIKVIYWIFTGLLASWMTLKGFNFVFNASHYYSLFQALGYPVALIIPLGLAKVLASLVILVNKFKKLKLEAYIGLAIDFMVALIGHLMANDDQWHLAMLALVLLTVSYATNLKLNPVNSGPIY